jgi:hypothetical protein
MVIQLRKVYLSVYRLLGFVMLFGIASAIFVFLSLMTFFMFNSTWAAPTVLSSTSDRMLQFAGGFQTADQNLETLLVAEAQAERDEVFAEDNLKHLVDLGQRFAGYKGRIDSLSQVKNRQFIQSYDLLKKLDNLIVITQQSLKSGLITNDEATQTITAIQQFHNGTTDSNMALNTLHISNEAQIVQLIGQIEQAVNDVATKKDMLAASRHSLKVASEIVSTLKQSAYYDAFMRHGSNLAFIPYDNIKSAKVGAPVYSCLLTVVLCSKVGTVHIIYKDEQMVDFPIFNVRFSRTVRGVLMDLSVTDQTAMGGKILFVGSKPLFL